MKKYILPKNTFKDNTFFKKLQNTHSIIPPLKDFSKDSIKTRQPFFAPSKNLFSNVINKNINTKKFSNPKDWDNDGVPNKKDCQPHNPMRQDWNIRDAKRKGQFVVRMPVKEFLKLTETEYHYDWQKPKTYFDTKLKTERQISTLINKIKSPTHKIDLPYIEADPYPTKNKPPKPFSIPKHDGRIRAFAAMEAKRESIPVVMPPPKEWRTEQVFKKFMELREPGQNPEFYNYDSRKRILTEDIFPDKNLEPKDRRKYKIALKETGTVPDKYFLGDKTFVYDDTSLDEIKPKPQSQPPDKTPDPRYIRLQKRITDYTKETPETAPKIINETQREESIIRKDPNSTTLIKYYPTTYKVRIPVERDPEQDEESKNKLTQNYFLTKGLKKSKYQIQVKHRIPTGKKAKLVEELDQIDNDLKFDLDTNRRQELLEKKNNIEQQLKRIPGAPPTLPVRGKDKHEIIQQLDKRFEATSGRKPFIVTDALSEVIPKTRLITTKDLAEARKERTTQEALNYQAQQKALKLLDDKLLQQGLDKKIVLQFSIDELTQRRKPTIITTKTSKYVEKQLKQKQEAKKERIRDYMRDYMNQQNLVNRAIKEEEKDVIKDVVKTEENKEVPEPIIEKQILWYKQPQQDEESKNKFGDKAGVPIVDFPESYGYLRKKVFMHPNEFMLKAQQGYSNQESRSWPQNVHEKAVISTKNVERLKKIINDPEQEMAVPWLETKQGIIKEHEGRHRAIAARELGFEEIPVFMVETDKEFVKEQKKIDSDNESKNGGHLFWNKLNEKNISVLNSTDKEQGKFTKDLKKLKNVFEKRPELLERSKNLTYVFLENKDFMNKAGSYQGPSEEKKQEFLETFPNIYKGEGEIIYLNSDELYKNNKKLPFEEVIAHELGHREDYNKNPEKALEENQLDKMEYKKIDLFIDKQQNKLNNFIQQGHKSKRQIKKYKEQLEEENNNYIGKIYETLPGEQHAIMRQKEPRERDKKVPEEQIDEAFIQTFDTEKNIQEDKESKNAQLYKITKQSKLLNQLHKKFGDGQYFTIQDVLPLEVINRPNIFQGEGFVGDASGWLRTDAANKMQNFAKKGYITKERYNKNDKKFDELHKRMGKYSSNQYVYKFNPQEVELTKEQWDEQIIKNPGLILKHPSPTKEQWDDATLKSYKLLSKHPNPTNELWDKIVLQAPFTRIDKHPAPTKELWDKAINIVPDLITNHPNPTKEQWDKAIEKKPYILSMRPNITQEQWDEYITKEPRRIVDHPSPTKEQWDKVININPYLISNHPNPTKEQWDQVIKEDPQFITKHPSATKEQWARAIIKRPVLINDSDVPKEQLNLTKEQWDQVIKEDPQFITKHPSATKEQWDRAIIKNPYLLEKYSTATPQQWIDNVDRKIISNRPDFILKHPSPDDELWETALYTQPKLIINHPSPTKEQWDQAIIRKPELLNKHPNKTYETWGKLIKSVPTMKKASLIKGESIAEQSWEKIIPHLKQIKHIDLWNKIIKKNSALIINHPSPTKEQWDQAILRNPKLIINHPSPTKEQWGRAINFEPYLIANSPYAKKEDYDKSIDILPQTKIFSPYTEKKELITLIKKDPRQLKYLKNKEKQERIAQIITPVFKEPLGKEEPEKIPYINNTQLFNLAFLTSNKQEPIHKQQIEKTPLINKPIIKEFIKQHPTKFITQTDILEYDKKISTPTVITDPNNVEIGYSIYNSPIQRLTKTPNVVFQYNLKNDKVKNFIDQYGLKQNIGDYQEDLLHPTSIKQDLTLGMIRLNPLNKETIFVEEIQSDLPKFIEKDNKTEFEEKTFESFNKEILNKYPHIKKIIMPSTKYKDERYGVGENLNTIYDNLPRKQGYKIMPEEERKELFEQHPELKAESPLYIRNIEEEKKWFEEELKQEEPKQEEPKQDEESKNRFAKFVDKNTPIIDLQKKSINKYYLGSQGKYDYEYQTPDIKGVVYTKENPKEKISMNKNEIDSILNELEKVSKEMTAEDIIKRNNLENKAFKSMSDKEKIMFRTQQEELMMQMSPEQGVKIMKLNMGTLQKIDERNAQVREENQRKFDSASTFREKFKDKIKTNIIENNNNTKEPEQDEESKNKYKLDISKYGHKTWAEDLGLNPEKTIVHGTNLDSVKQIIKDKEIKSGTLLYPGRGGIEDAALWANNTTGKEGYVIVAETKDKLPRTWAKEWITIGDHADERQGKDIIIDKFPIEKIKVFKVPKDIEYNKGILEEEENIGEDTTSKNAEDKKTMEELYEGHLAFKKRQEEKNKEYDELVQDVNDVDEKTLKILQYSAENYRKEREPQEHAKQLREIKELVYNKPLGVAITPKGVKPIIFNENEAAQFSTRMDRAMTNMIIETEAKEQLARTQYNNYYHNLSPQEKRKIDYRINKHIAK